MVEKGFEVVRQVKLTSLMISALRTFSHVKKGKKYQEEVRKKRAEVERRKLK